MCAVGLCPHRKLFGHIPSFYSLCGNSTHLLMIKVISRPCTLPPAHENGIPQLAEEKQLCRHCRLRQVRQDSHFTQRKPRLTRVQRSHPGGLKGHSLQVVRLRYKTSSVTAGVRLSATQPESAFGGPLGQHSGSTPAPMATDDALLSYNYRQ